MPEILYVAAFFSILLTIYIRGKILDSKIMKHSKKIELIKELNTNFNFHNLNRSLMLNKHYDNKGHYNKIEPAYLMSAYLRDNLADYSIYIGKMKENRVNKLKYNKKLSVIVSQPLDSEYRDITRFKREYKNREKKLSQKDILYPTVNCSFIVRMSYSSPKGQVNISKDGCFSFDDLVVSFDSVSRTYLDRNAKKKLALVERGEISDSLRYDILNRDDFKCVICGASSKEGVRLHVDHIIPVSKGGKSRSNNLRTLCERCNVGKSDKIEDISITESVIQESKNNLCPRCGAKLVLRQSIHGDFYGCSGFPKCKFTKDIWFCIIGLQHHYSI